MRKIFIVLFLMLSTAAIAQQQRPTRLAGERDAGYNIGSRPSVKPDGVETFAVPEPGAIVLLGAGLVSLGIYAKRKQGKKN
jgi:hypothetical protein